MIPEMYDFMENVQLPKVTIVCQREQWFLFGCINSRLWQKSKIQNTPTHLVLSLTKRLTNSTYEYKIINITI